MSSLAFIGEQPAPAGALYDRAHAEAAIQASIEDCRKVSGF